MRRRARTEATPAKRERARATRAAPTVAEAALWKELRYRRLGYRFRRQHPISGFVVDFYCPNAGLAIEVDGDVHEETTERDATRDSVLAKLGVTVLRVRNQDVLRRIDVVLASIRAALRSKHH